MKIGNLTIEVFGELLQKNSVELLQNVMYQPLISISESFDFDYRRFGFYAATLLWEIPLTIFWKNDLIYNTLKENLEIHFTNWEIDIYISIIEKGD